MSRTGHYTTNHSDSKPYGFELYNAPYKEDEINKIEDPSEGSIETSRIPIAIPSPFARLDLTATAFGNMKKLCDYNKIPNNQDSQNAEPIVSDGDKKLISDTLDLLELIFFRGKELVFTEVNDDDIVASNPKAQNFVDVLKLYIDADDKYYKLKESYYEGGESKTRFDMKIIEYDKKIIGGTSWQTLVFPSANTKFLSDIEVNGAYLFKKIRTFDSRNKRFKLWLKNILQGKDNAIGNYISGLQINEVIDYQTQELNISIAGDIKFTCLEKPFEFENYIIEIPYQVSDNFNCLSVKDTKGMLLQDKICLFPFKTEKDIIFDSVFATYNKSKENITKGELSEEIIIGYNDYYKIYTREKKDNSVIKNEIVTCHFDIALFPFVAGASQYRIALFEARNKHLETRVALKDKIFTRYEKNEREAVIYSNKLSTITYKNDGKLITSNAVELECEYRKKKFSALIVLNPTKFVKFDQNDGVDDKNIVFAVDFGTTNTNIAYKVNNANKDSGTLQVTESLDNTIVSGLSFDDGYVGYLHNPKNKYEQDSFFGEKTLKENFLPRNIEGKYFGSLLNSTLGTAENGLETLTQYNILFESLSTAGLIDNLKWKEGQKKEYKYFLEEIIFILYAKVLLLKGKPENAKIFYTYPMSMGPIKLESFKNDWKNTVEKYFGNIPLDAMAESITPIKYFMREGQQGFKLNDENNNPLPVLTIDIGGGTTDCSIVSSINGKKRLVLHTSFRLAGSSLFGEAGEDNALTDKYIDIYLPPEEEKTKSEVETEEDFIQKNATEEQKDRLKNAEDNKKARTRAWIINNLKIKGIKQEIKTDNSKKLLNLDQENTFRGLATSKNKNAIHSFLFSIGKDMDGKTYAERLRGDSNVNIRLVFLYYLSSIIWHNAKIIKKTFLKSINDISSFKLATEESPFITALYFSGNGSKLLNILDITKDKDYIKFLVKCIFEKVYFEKKYGTKKLGNFDLVFDEENAKILTSVGCLVKDGDDTIYGTGTAKDKTSGIKPGKEIEIYKDSSDKEIEIELLQFNKDFLDIMSEKYEDSKYNIVDVFEIPKSHIDSFNEYVGKIDILTILSNNRANKGPLFVVHKIISELLKGFVK